MFIHTNFSYKQLRYESEQECVWCSQGLLALEGELTPILVQMVKSANMNGLLDSDSDSLSSCQQKVKARLHEILQKDRDFTPEDFEKVRANLGQSYLRLLKRLEMEDTFRRTFLKELVCEELYCVVNLGNYNLSSSQH